MLRRRRIVIAAGLLVAGIALLFLPLLVTRVDTGGRLTSDPADVSHHQVALVLGAGLTVPDWGRVPAAKMVHYQAREVLADVKAVWDADVTTPSPRYLGAHEQLHLQPAAAGAG
jgi:vancomycin permeability regulator SanA